MQGELVKGSECLSPTGPRILGVGGDTGCDAASLSSHLCPPATVLPAWRWSSGEGCPRH